MDVVFTNRTLERRYRSRADAVRAWGYPAGRKYARVVDVLYNVADVAELSALRSLRLHRLHGELADRWTIQLHDRWRMILSFEDDTIRIHEVSRHYGD